MSRLANSRQDKERLESEKEMLLQQVITYVTISITFIDLVIWSMLPSLAFFTSNNRNTDIPNNPNNPMNRIY